MRPTLTTFDSANGVLKNAIFSGNDTLEPCILSNQVDLNLSKLGRTAPLTPIGSPMFNSICLIVCRGIPSKIMEMVMPRIPIIMAAFHSFGSCANEGRKHQSVWSNYLLLSILPYVKKWPIVTEMRGWFFHLPRRAGIKIAKVRNPVESFVPNNINKNFHDYPRSNSMGILYHETGLGA